MESGPLLRQHDGSPEATRGEVRVADRPVRGTNHGGRSAMPYGVLIWMVAVSIWFAWSPFQVRATPPSYALVPTLDLDLVGHLLFLNPLAIALAVGTDGRWRRPFLYPWAVATAVAIGLEVGQWWLPGRSVGAHDVLLGSFGSAVAIGATRKVLAMGARPRWILTATFIVTLLAVGTTLWAGAIFPQRSFRLAGWDASFEVVAGSEVGGVRTYRGQVRDAQICGGRRPDRVCIGPSASEAEREALVRLVRGSQELWISAWVLPESSNQTGPARIVTFSEGVSSRNVTLAQEGSDLVFRVRTPRTGPNGTYPQFVLRSSLPEHAWRRVGALFSRGRVTMVADGDGVRVSGVYPQGPTDAPLATQLEDRRRTAPFFAGRGAIVGAAVLFSGIGFGVTWLLRNRRYIRYAGGAGCAALFLGVYDGLVVGIGARQGTPILLAAAAGFLGTLLALMDRGRWT